MSIRDTYKQYGWKFFPRLIKSGLRRFGIQHEVFYLLEWNVNAEELNRKMEGYDFSDIQELTIADFQSSDSFSEQKKNLFQARLKSKEYSCYGIKLGDEIVYSTWISWNMMGYPSYFNKTDKLQQNEALLEDSFCHPTQRGKGLHSKMNLFRMQLISERGRSAVLALVLKENTPALNVQLKSGFRIVKEIRFFKVGNLRKIKEIVVNGNL
ncbi:hypothetical protein [Fluviicola taffensis]|uniref:hypothetical protein n=1 Tax=Fluviicola taffensis TaxID=191579 RepID=UPI0031383116